MYYHGPQPPWWPQPIYTPQMDPRNPTANMNSTKELRRAIKFYQRILQEEEDRKKKKDGGKPPNPTGFLATGTFTVAQWVALLIISAPFLGLGYCMAFLKLLNTLVNSMPH